MCQALVGKVVKVNGSAGTVSVEHSGKTEVLNAKLVEVAEGDYVTFSKGMAIEKIDKEEADMILGNIE